LLKNNEDDDGKYLKGVERRRKRTEEGEEDWRE